MVQKMPFFAFISSKLSQFLNLRFFLKHKACLFKSACEVFQFRFRFVLIKADIFLQQKVWPLSLKRHNSCQN